MKILYFKFSPLQALTPEQGIERHPKMSDLEIKPAHGVASAVADTGDDIARLDPILFGHIKGLIVPIQSHKPLTMVDDNE